MSDPPRAQRFAGAILAGGEARRLGGAHKGNLEAVPGLSIIEQSIHEIRKAGIDTIVISANAPEPYADAGSPIVPDLRPGLGPLAGIESALVHFENAADAVLFLPCDLPAIRAREIRTLLEAFSQTTAPIVFAETPRPAEAPQWHPLCSIVRLQALPAVRKILDETSPSGEQYKYGRSKRAPGVSRLWRDLGAQPIRFEDPRPFHNVNTAEDLEQWRASNDRDKES